MQNRSSRSLPLMIAAGVSIFALATGGAVAWWNWTAARNSSIPTPTVTIAPASPLPPVVSQPSTQPSIPASPKERETRRAATEKSPQVYWLKNSGSQIQLVSSPAELNSTNSIAPLKSALSQLLAGPKTAAVSTTIPSATRLRSVAVQEDGIHVDLSQGFRTGGGTASMTGRVAQVLYTATSLDPDAPVWLSVEGKPIDSIGGEGLMLEQPLTRKRFKQDFSL
ncbi:MAG TPA: GerMN domain-containing protein [Thermosynechococcaceae cyanobacterium]